MWIIKTKCHERYLNRFNISTGQFSQLLLDFWQTLTSHIYIYIEYLAHCYFLAFSKTKIDFKTQILKVK